MDYQDQRVGLPLYLQVIKVILVSAYKSVILLRSVHSWLAPKIKILASWIAAAAHRVHQIMLPFRPVLYWIQEIIFLAGAVILFVILWDFFWI